MHPGQLIPLTSELLRMLHDADIAPATAGAPHERALALAVALVAACAAVVLALS
ncbi:MAG: hypothetical protein HY855_07100 [Burkholderiales bacterium]|nr:hypothetical protein [Burkholderiales bacterium]